MLNKKITITGAVQGVGFRPFVYRIARQIGVLGEVYNDGAGVIIIAKCSKMQLDKLLSSINNDAPKIAKITNIIIKDNNENHKTYIDFSIGKSNKGNLLTIVLPDISICNDCIDDITNRSNRRYGYAFTNCTNCGPRFSIVKQFPYDRNFTSMSAFPMCADCNKEYLDPVDRRFHAQPNACSDCGPQLQLIDAIGNNIFTNDIISATVSLLKQEKIIAIKGIGGFHLACLASCESVVVKLRQKKHRKHKPFALMATDVAMVKKYCIVSNDEENLLTDRASPIVLLSKLNDLLATQIAPKQNKLGFMLPYSPLHYLLLQQLNEPLVLTSANKSNNPQIIDNQQALNELKEIVDYFLIHNRDIINRVDDSVVQYVAAKARVIRRARGYAPTSLPLPKGFEDYSGVLAVGAELKNTFCLFTKTQAVISQHIGDLKTLESYQDFQKNIQLYKQLYDVNINMLACDLHPNYLSSKYAENNNIKRHTVQHHHAHISACMFEHGIELNTNKVLGIAWDGIGLGTDNCLWGGEFLLADYAEFNRVAHFEYMPLFGGDKVATEPWRMAYAYFKQYKLPTTGWFEEKPIEIFDKLLNMPLHYTSSVGRLFDAVAYILGICNNQISYEAQAAIELENLATYCEQEYEFEFNMVNDCYQISSHKMWLAILQDIKNNVKKSEIAYKFHLSLSRLLLKTTLKLKDQYSFDTVVLSGGVFNNKLLLELVCELFESENIRLLSPSQIPSGDGGISLGQAAVCVAQNTLI
jgi:hydrogenase maturation protein HypF